MTCATHGIQSQVENEHLSVCIFIERLADCCHFSLTVVTMGLNIATYTQLYDGLIELSSMTKPHSWYGHGEAGDTWPGVLD